MVADGFPQEAESKATRQRPVYVRYTHTGFFKRTASQLNLNSSEDARTVRHPWSPNFNVVWRQCFVWAFKKNSHSCWEEMDTLIQGSWCFRCMLKLFSRWLCFLKNPVEPGSLCQDIYIYIYCIYKYNHIYICICIYIYVYIHMKKINT